jgi:hypothetical protein
MIKPKILLFIICLMKLLTQTIAEMIRLLCNNTQRVSVADYS